LVSPWYTPEWLIIWWAVGNTDVGKELKGEKNVAHDTTPTIIVELFSFGYWFARNPGTSANKENNLRSTSPPRVSIHRSLWYLLTLVSYSINSFIYNNSWSTVS
jgi:hypothetical protein